MSGDNSEEHDFIFTRYLFPKTEVKQALLLALLEHKTSESLYWGYELYYSGFEMEVFEYLWSIYDILYKEENPRLSKMFLDIKNRRDDREPSEKDVGSLLMTLSKREYNLSGFTEMFFNRKCSRDKDIVYIQPSKFIINISPNSIKQYKTLEVNEKDKPNNILKRVYCFPLRKEYNHLFNCPIIDDYNERYREHWLTYTHGCPLWEKRIAEYMDDDEEGGSDEFYDKYGYEPDEQSFEIQSMVIGKMDTMDTIESVNLDAFCSFLGYSLYNEFLV
jgi:hypothetical protein